MEFHQLVRQILWEQEFVTPTSTGASVNTDTDAATNGIRSETNISLLTFDGGQNARADTDGLPAQLGQQNTRLDGKRMYSILNGAQMNLKFIRIDQSRLDYKPCRS